MKLTVCKNIPAVVPLAREDAMRFFEALAAPPPPNDRLRAALEEHARRVDSR